MTLTVHRTPYGRPASRLLHARVAAAKREDPLHPVTVVVPTNFVGVSVRRLLASGALGPVSPAGAGVAGVTFVTVYRLAELLGAARLAATGRRPVSTPVIAAAVRGALAGDPGYFAPVAEHPSTERALVGSYRELSDVPDDALDALSSAGPRAADVVRLHRAARARLASGWYDEGDLMSAARAGVESRTAAVAELGTVVVHLPQDLSRRAAGLVGALARVAPVEVLAGGTGVPGADRAVERTLARMGAAAAGAASPERPVEQPGATAAVCVSDADEEVRAVVGRVVAALRDGVALERVAILYPHRDPYARLVHEHLSAAGIPYNGAAVRSLADRLAGRWLLDALRLPDRRYRRQDVLDLLASAPVRTRGGGAAPVAAWERASRQAGVVGGAREWDERLAGHALRLRSEAAQAEQAQATGEDETRPWLPGRLREEARAAESLRGFVLELIGRLERARRLTSWAGLSGWALQLLERYLGDEQARADWPEEEVRAAGKVEAALDRLAVLEAVEPEASLPRFRRTLELELDSDLDRVGQFGHGLLAGPLPVALGVDLDVVVVLGCAEGVLPARVREDSLLPDAERVLLADDLPPRSEHVDVAHRHLLAALAAGQKERILTYPRGDLRRSVERPPSRWLLDATRHLAGAAAGAGGAGTLPASAPWVEYRPSFAASALTAEPASRLELHLRLLGAHRAGGGTIDEHALARDDPALARGLALLRARDSAAFTRFDGNLSHLPGLVPAPAGGGALTSPTRLEAWARCPLRYLLEYVLRVEVVDAPEEALEISPLDRGTLVHEVLETWLARHIEAGRVPAPEEPWPAGARAELHAVAAEACDAYEQRGLVGHPLLWSRDRKRLLLDLARFVDRDDERRARLGVRPVAAEVPFGLAGRPPVAVALDGDRVVRLRGKVDRLDAGPDGRLVVTDYKTGGSHGIGDLTADDPVLGGTRLQLPVYALAARAHAGDDGAPVLAEYWFVTTRHGFKAHGYDVGEGVLEALRGALGTIVEGIAAGHFPARPVEPGWRPFVDCAYCDPDGLGTAARWRDWRRKRLAPELRAYLALVEPDDLPEPAAAVAR